MVRVCGWFACVWVGGGLMRTDELDAVGWAGSVCEMETNVCLAA